MSGDYYTADEVIQRIRISMALLGVKNQTALAKRLGVTPAMVSAMLSGKKHLSASILEFAGFSPRRLVMYTRDEAP